MPDMVRGLPVLEIGSGTGLCGLLAAKLGAAEVWSLLPPSPIPPSRISCVLADDALASHDQELAAMK